VKKFHGGFQTDLSIFQQAPSPEVDKALENLYNGDSLHGGTALTEVNQDAS
jgi:hypothetical protein